MRKTRVLLKPSGPVRAGRSAGRNRGSGWTLFKSVRFVVVVVGYGFVLGPIVPVMIQSVNTSSVFPAQFRGFTLRWFAELAAREEFVQGAVTSGYIGLGATMLALAIGVAASFALVRGPAWMRGSAATSVLMGPIVIPQIVIGLAMLQLLTAADLDLAIPGLIFAHGVFISPFVVRSVAAALESQGHEFEETAMVLGAKPFRVLYSVTLPMLRSAIIASAVFAFTLSFVNVPLSLFLAPSSERPLPISVFQFMTNSLNPMIAALALVLVAVVVAVSVFTEKVLRVRLLQ